MTPNVFILATCRKPELAPMTELVFKTLRVGFPTAKVTVSLNGDCERQCPNIKSVAELAHCIVVDEPETIHHVWIENLIESEQEPFYLLDTDVIFYQDFEGFYFEGDALAGYRIPEFQDQFTGAITRSRLHTSLLYVDPVLVREQLEKYESQFPVTPFNPLANPYHPLCLPMNGRGYFYDTCSMLYQAIGGTEFVPEHKQAYFHFHYGSLADIVLPRLDNAEGIARVRDEILNNPELGRGMWRAQDEYLASRCPVLDGRDVIAPVTPEEARDASHWKQVLCNGNTEAMVFCDVFYGYVHSIDDLLDSAQDGRPIMSKRQMLGLFFQAAVLYNLPFYKQNHALLFPIILDITNLYAISVEWEVSPKPHLRAMADVFRTSGNRMYSMIALICGGPDHMYDISKHIHDRDWCLQHDKDGNPT